MTKLKVVFFLEILRARLTKRRKLNRSGYMFRSNCLLYRVIAVMIEVTRRRERRSKQLLDDLKQTTGY